jgi:hypothetical protein
VKRILRVLLFEAGIKKPESKDERFGLRNESVKEL